MLFYSEHRQITRSENNMIYQYPTQISISHSFLDIVKTRPKCNLYDESIVRRIESNIKLNE